MPSAREINRRIKSVTNTQQITKAMKMVSSVRLRRAQDRALATAPFTDKIEAMLRRLAAAASGEAGPLFEQREVKRTCYIVVGADKGLAGAFSSNINKAMAAIVAEKGRDAVTFLVTGRKPVEYLKRLRITPAGKWSGFSDKPQYHHAQTVMHEAVKRFIHETDKGTVRKEIEKLIAGETIVKEIHQELTYQDMYASIENLWSVLFTTGYLTQTGRKDANTFMLTIPNMEIRNIFLTQIMEYFKKTVSENGEALEKFCNALKDGNSEVVEQSLNNYLKRTISIRDTFVKKQMKENFYHGILLGILGFQQSWSVSSNKESGDGYSDILIETEDQETGIIIEIKYAETGNLEAVSEEALKQIEDRRYEEQLLEEGVEHILKYGIAFYKKKCRVMTVK